MRAERAHRAALRRVTTRFRKGVTVDACSSHVDLANGQFTGSMRGSQIRSHDGSVLSQSHAHVTNAPTTLPQPSTGQEVQDVLFAERAGVPFLWYRDHAGAPVLRVLEAETGQLTVGRHSSSDLALPWDDAVSRSHAVLERLGRTWTLVDDGLSRNGTYVNGTRLRGRVRLHDRDALRFGGTLMRFRAPVSQASVGATRVDDDALVTAESLTPMQRKVLVALCRPFRDNPTYATPATNQTIADELVLSVDAIKTHMRGIFQRFGVQELPHNQKRARVVELAFQSGVIGERDL